jgi:hypothetical protein
VAEQLGTLSFASWLRQGLAAGIGRPDGGGQSGAETVVQVAVRFENGLSATANLALVGPGDIVGLDSNVVVRVWPKPNDNDAEFESMALIEFDQADLPWRYTPSAPTATTPPGGQLRPWINLLVLKESEASIAPPTPSLKQTVVTVTNPAALPNLAEAWAWAHTQFIGQNLAAEQLPNKIKGAHGQFASRIISPRLLEPSTSYIACLVPTFERGAVLARTGQLPDANVDALSPAWTAGAAGVKLPVYFFWRFQTGTTGSFQQLAKLIQPKKLPDGVGRRSMDVGNPGLALPSPVIDAPRTLQVEGAIQSFEAFQAGPSRWDTPDRTRWVDGLKQFLNTPQVVVDGVPVKVVAPPLYGQWYAAQRQLDAPTNPPWFFALNSDPRSRVGGGLGTVVVQNHQQALLASAWNQVGEINAVNSRLKVAQLGREVLRRLFERHVVTGTSDTVWTMTGRLHAFARCGGKALCVRFDESPVGHWIFDPAWRRVSRPLGALGRFQGKPLLPPGFTSDVIARLNAGQHPAPEPPTPFGLFTHDRIFERICFDGLTPVDLGKLIGIGPDLLLFWGLVIMYSARQLIVSQNGECFWHAIRMLRFGMTLIWIANSISGTNPGDATRRIHWCQGIFSCDDLKAAPTAPNFAPLRFPTGTLPLPPLVGGGPNTAAATAFRADFCSILDGPQPPPPPIPPPPSIPDLNECRLELQRDLDPAITVERRFNALIHLDPSVVWNPKDRLEPIFLPPKYQAPMYVPLAEESKDWIMPGINDVERDTVGLGMTNQRFVEAYMVGCNQELTRELLFNEFPVDQRATYFRQFWDIAGIVPPQGSPIDPETLRDILPIAGWSPTATLGSNSARAGSPNGSERLVLVVRAQLVQKYPNVIVYAVPAQVDTSTGRLVLSNDEVHPVFYGTIAPDVAFYGFDIAVDKVRTTPGYFFVLQEHPTEPKFQITSPPGTMVSPPPGGTGTTSGQVANAIFHDPFRIAIHGSVLLPSTS